MGGNSDSQIGPPRAFAQYSIVGESCYLSVKLIPPKFSFLRDGTLILENKNRGRLLFEFSPRSSDGVVQNDRKSQIRIALSAEELALILDQLPANQVKLVRKSPSEPISADVAESKFPEKVFIMTPREAGILSLSVDYVLNNVGGQTETGEGSGVGPLELSAQLGEVQVLRRIMKSSILYLVGWQTMAEIQDQRTRQFLEYRYQQGGSGSSGNNYGRGGSSNEPF